VLKSRNACGIDSYCGWWCGDLKNHIIYTNDWLTVVDICPLAMQANVNASNTILKISVSQYENDPYATLVKMKVVTLSWG
jgi:hypothetical protein